MAANIEHIKIAGVIFMELMAKDEKGKCQNLKKIAKKNVGGDRFLMKLPFCCFNLHLT